MCILVLMLMLEGISVGWKMRQRVPAGVLPIANVRHRSLTGKHTNATHTQQQRIRSWISAAYASKKFVPTVVSITWVQGYWTFSENISSLLRRCFPVYSQGCRDKFEKYIHRSPPHRGEAFPTTNVDKCKHQCLISRECRGFEIDAPANRCYLNDEDFVKFNRIRASTYYLRVKCVDDPRGDKGDDQ
jgi:hypothetical protein